jgi:hypothetical protein
MYEEWGCPPRESLFRENVSSNRRILTQKRLVVEDLVWRRKDSVWEWERRGKGKSEENASET